MKREEVRNVLSILRLNYPQSFRDYTNESAEMFLNMWAEAFKNDPAEAVVNAVKAIIYSDPREFAPNIAQIKQKMIRLSGDDSDVAENVWSNLRAMLSKLPSQDPEEVEEYWDKLPTSVKRIYSPNDLIELAWHRTSTDLSNYEFPRFKKVYESVKHQELLMQIETGSGIKRAELPDVTTVLLIHGEDEGNEGD